MSLKKILLTLAIITIALSFTSCRKSSPRPSKKAQNSHRSLNLSGKSESFKVGASDGCTTARGTYKKNHDAFNTNLEYYNGWFAGRMNCEGR